MNEQLEMRNWRLGEGCFLGMMMAAGCRVYMEVACVPG